MEGSKTANVCADDVCGKWKRICECKAVTGRCDFRVANLGLDFFGSLRRFFWTQTQAGIFQKLLAQVVASESDARRAGRKSPTVLA